MRGASLMRRILVVRRWGEETGGGRGDASSANAEFASPPHSPGYDLESLPEGLTEELPSRSLARNTGKGGLAGPSTGAKENPALSGWPIVKSHAHSATRRNNGHGNTASVGRRAPEAHRPSEVYWTDHDRWRGVNSTWKRFPGSSASHHHAKTASRDSVNFGP